jgi:hypothetical protein
MAATQTAERAAAAADSAAQQQAARDQQAAAQAAKDRVAADRAGAATREQLAEQKAAADRQAAEAAALRKQVADMTPRDYTLEAGTIIPVRTTAVVSTKMSTGATFDGLLEQDLVANGTVLAKSGARVTCVLTSSDPGGRVKGVASLAVAARAIQGVGGPIAITTSSVGAEAKSTKGRDAKRTAIATGAGAVIGAIAGGGKGAAIGAGVGAGTGVGVNAATRGDAAEIPAETLIEFELEAPVTVTLTPKAR